MALKSIDDIYKYIAESLGEALLDCGVNPDILSKAMDKAKSHFDQRVLDSQETPPEPPSQLDQDGYENGIFNIVVHYVMHLRTVMDDDAAKQAAASYLKRVADALTEWEKTN